MYLWYIILNVVVSSDLEKDHICLLKKALLTWVQFKQCMQISSCK